MSLHRDYNFKSRTLMLGFVNEMGGHALWSKILG